MNVLAGMVFHRRFHGDESVSIHHVVKMGVNPIHRQMHPGGGEQLHMAVQSAAGIPAAVGSGVRSRRHRQPVLLAKLQKRGQIHGKGRVAVVMVPRHMAICHDLGLTEAAVKPHQNPAALPLGGNVQHFGVGHDGTLIAAAVDPIFRGGGHIGLDHVVMGQVHRPLLGGHHGDAAGFSLLQCPVPADICVFHVRSLLTFYSFTQRTLLR